MNQAQKQAPFDLGVVAVGSNIYLYTNLHGFKNPFHLCVSKNGFGFKGTSELPKIVTDNGTAENTSQIKDFNVAKIGKQFIATYHHNESFELHVANSADLIHWQKIGTVKNFSEPAAIVPSNKDEKKYVMYVGHKDIKLAFSSDLVTWEEKATVLQPRQNYFDKTPLKVETVMLTDEGILVFYSVREHFREGQSISIGAALFDKNDPGKLLWRRSSPVFVQQESEGKHMYPLGAVKLKDKLFLYFGVRGESVFAVYFENFADIFSEMPGKVKPKLQKHEGNPIMEPVLEHHWESQGAFNPAAVYDDGKVHLMYRAMGNNTSFIGYATSNDGVTIDERSKSPAFWPSQEFDTPGKTPNIMYMSGGGYGGCEDPRVTKIEEDGKVYLTYIGYNGSDPPRVALSSIDVEDFRKQNWNWETPKLISRPGVVDKNACLFPEKINGKYAILHRIFPNILLDFVDDLNFKEDEFLKGEYSIQPSDNGWDSRKVGAGAPPIKTNEGWLLIYHAVDDKNDSQYKIGAMLLDLKDPTKVLHRSQNPILEPTEWYENHGFKAGVAYPCGAVVLNGNLYVYYGGADQVVCVAKHNLDEFLEQLKSQKPNAPLPPHKSRTVVQHNYAFA